MASVGVWIGFFSMLLVGAHAGEGAPKKILHWSIGDDLKTLDPALSTDRNAYTVLTLSAETLYQYAYRKIPAEIEPLLASALPKVSADGLTYLFSIRKGVRFQDDPAFPGGKGRELKAQDFVYSWKRLFLPNMAASRRAVFEGHVEGVAQFKKRLAEAAPNQIESVFTSAVSGLSVVDDYTLRVKLVAKYPAFSMMLTQLTTSVVPHEAVEYYGAENLTDHLIGTGPYALRTLERGSQIVMQKNPTYRGKSPLDEIQFRIFREETPAWLHFMRGELDQYGVAKDEYIDVIHDGALSDEMKKKGVQLRSAPDLAVFLVALNMKDARLGANPDIRRAISCAIDRKKWLELFRGGQGVLATGLIPPGLSGYTKRKKLPWGYDLDEAKRLLAKAGYPEGKGLAPIHFDVGGASTTSRQEGELLTQQLGRIGIKVEVNLNTTPAFLTKMHDGSFEILSGNFIAAYGDPETFLKNAYGKFVAPGPNMASWKNTEYDALFDRILTLAPSERRRRLIEKAENLVLNDAVLLPMYHPMVHSLQQGWVKNYWPGNRLALNALKYVEIDLDAKRRLHP